MENEGWYVDRSHTGVKDRSTCMHSRKPSLHVRSKKEHYHIVHLVSAINFIQVIPVTLHAVFFLNLLLLALSLQSWIPYLPLSICKGLRRNKNLLKWLCSIPRSTHFTDSGCPMSRRRVVPNGTKLQAAALQEVAELKLWYFVFPGKL